MGREIKKYSCNKIRNNLIYFKISDLNFKYKKIPPCGERVGSGLQFPEGGSHFFYCLCQKVAQPVAYFLTFFMFVDFVKIIKPHFSLFFCTVNKLSFENVKA